MNDHMLIEEIKNPNDRNMIYDMATRKIKELNNEIENLENKKSQIDDLLNKELKEYEVSFNKNKERAISGSEFDKIDKNHRFRMNALNLKKMSLKMKQDSLNSFSQRMLCLCWLLKIPYGQDKIEVTKTDTNEKAIINKSDIYSKYFDYIANGEKNRLQNEQSFYRLQLDFNNIPNFPIDENHEFYANSNVVREKLINIKDEISDLQSSVKTFNGNTNGLLVEDFFNENGKQVFEQIFLKQNEDKLEQLFQSEEHKENNNGGKRVA